MRIGTFFRSSIPANRAAIASGSTVSSSSGTRYSEDDGVSIRRPKETNDLVSTLTGFGPIVSALGSLSFAGRGSTRSSKVNQDRFWVNDLSNNEGSYKFVGVADGHGIYGHLVSEMVREKLGVILEKHPLLGVDPKSALMSAHSRLNAEIFDSIIDSSFSGSTSVSLLFIDRRIYCANVGDSRAILGSLEEGSWVSTPLSFDHKADLPNEKKRILDQGGRISEYRNTNGERVGPARVWLKNKSLPGLAMSRSFGDKAVAEVGVISEPEITETSLDPRHKVIVVASDGVWEFLDNDQVLKIISPYHDVGDARGAARAVCEGAHNRWVSQEGVVDDITVIVLFLR